MTPTIIRHCKRGTQIGVVIDTGHNEWVFQVYSTHWKGNTQLIYSCPYSSFESKDGHMGALDHWLIYNERGNF